MTTTLTGRLGRLEGKLRAPEASPLGGSDAFQLMRSAGFIPDPWQKKVLRSAARHLLLNAARQTGKSLVCAVRALHKALSQPRSVTLVTSPSQRQAAELLRKVRHLLGRLPSAAALVDQESVLSLEFTNGSRIIALPGSEETIRGFTADLVLIDEAARINDDLIAAIRPMLAVTNGILVMLTTPWGKRGAFYEAWENGGPDWERIQATAYDVPRISPAWLKLERQQVPPIVFASEYECQFVDLEDALFGAETIRRAITDEIEPLLLDEVAA